MTPRRDDNTVFMTEQEAERIRNTVRTRLKRCSELEGREREPRDPQDAIRQATGASLMADMGAADPDSAQTKGQGGSLPALAVGQPYPPCTAPLRDLQPMKFSDLRMETHHRGRCLTVKRTSPTAKRASPVVTLMARSWTMVYDEEGGEIERLEVCLHKTRHGQDVLESATAFTIKEPYFTLTDQGEATLRIDHPSDLVVCRDETTGHILDSFDEAKHPNYDRAAALEFAKACKDQGNAALEKHDLPLAHAKYTDGLKVAMQIEESDLAKDLSRNRAHVNILLNQLDEAKADARGSLIGVPEQREKDFNGKAYFRAGCAAYNLGEYEEAKGFFKEQQRLTPGNETASTYLRKIEMRLREQKSGAYNFKKIKAGLSQSRPRVDAASFVGNTEVRESPGRGRGLFATRDISAGEMVMCEKAFCVVWGHEKEALTAMTYDVRDDRIRVSPVGLTKSVVEKLLSNPSQLEKVMGLHGDYQGNANDMSKTEDEPVVDTFRVHDIVCRNAFGTGNQFGADGVSHASTGLWIRAAYINHSCLPNTEKEYIGDLMVLRATQPIAAGQELFHGYDESSDYATRQRALMTTWGFECDCALCIVEETDDPAVRKKRKELAHEVDVFVQQEGWANARRLTIVKAKRLSRDIDSTYDGEKYKGLPRLAIRTIHEWLTLAGQKR